MAKLKGIRGIGIFDLLYQEHYLLLKSYSRMVSDAKSENRIVKFNFPDRANTDSVKVLSVDAQEIDITQLNIELKEFEAKLGYDESLDTEIGTLPAQPRISVSDLNKSISS